MIKDPTASNVQRQLKSTTALLAQFILESEEIRPHVSQENLAEAFFYLCKAIKCLDFYGLHQEILEAKL
jgi:hypothetical protein